MKHIVFILIAFFSLNNSNAQVKEKSYNYIPENSYSTFSLKFSKKQKNFNTTKDWVTSIIKKDNDGDLTYLTKRCFDYVKDVIENSTGIDGTIDDSTLNKKWGEKFDLEHSNFEHLFETGNGGWGTKKLTNFEYLGELNNADWFKLTIKGGSGENDYSTSLVRVIKIIKKGNIFYIDNFLAF